MLIAGYCPSLSRDEANCDRAVKYPTLVFRKPKLGNSWRMVDALTEVSDEGRSDLRKASGS